ncbi:hypothetical protein ACOSP7_016109 [Xanthoceras sorbifolium]
MHGSYHFNLITRMVNPGENSKRAIIEDQDQDSASGQETTPEEALSADHGGSNDATSICDQANPSAML